MLILGDLGALLQWVGYEGLTETEKELLTRYLEVQFGLPLRSPMVYIEGHRYRVLIMKTPPKGYVPSFSSTHVLRKGGVTTYSYD